MRWHLHSHGHDPTQIDLLAVVALLIISIGAFVYVASSDSSTPPNTAAFIVPSQSVHW